MADNIAVTQGTGTSIASDEVDGVHYQRVKATWGEDGVASDVTADSALPVFIAQLGDVEGALPVSVAPSESSIDGSTTITAGGTAEELFFGAQPPNGFQICNPDASEDLWVSDTAAAEANGIGSYRVPANGGIYTTPPGYKPLGAVSVIAATTGHKITARSW